MELYNADGYSPDTPPIFPDAEFPIAPESVRNTYKDFWQHASYNQYEITARARDMTLTNTLIDDFCDNYINESVYSAAMLGPIIDELGNPKLTDNAQHALRTYVEGTLQTNEDAAYVLGILSDRSEIEEFWRTTVADMYKDQPEICDELLTKTSIELPTEVWQPRAKLVMPARTHELLNSVNLESLLIGSVETLVQLSTSKVGKDSKTLQQVYRAESFFAPLCEIIGFDGLAMALQSRANTLRAVFTGREAQVAEAERIINERGNEAQVDEDVQALFSTVFGENIHEQVIKHATPHGIIIGEGLATSKNLRVVWRLKTIGSLANKLSATDATEFTPMDILGATVITKSEEEVAERLTRIIERSHSDPNVKMVPTIDRTDAVHVKGPPEYIDTVRRVLGFTTVDAMKRFVDVKEVAPDAHRVCKVTLVHSREGRPDLRAEIQLTTENDRIEARIGSAAHLLYKFAGSSEKAPDPAYLAAIHARKNELTLRRVYLVPASAERAANLYRDLSN